jgi:hypothetical protein
MTQYIANNLPMDQLDTLRPMYRTMAKLVGKRCVVRYRGPRYDSTRATTRKEDAKSWAVYFY